MVSTVRKKRDATLPGLPGRVTPTSLALQQGLSPDEWCRVLILLGRIGRGSQWWLGDALNYGEGAYGEAHAQYVEQAGYSVKTLLNLSWVAAAVAPERRREDLSWSHHEAVAGLDADKQVAWLAVAADGDHGLPWSVPKLRQAIRETRVDAPERLEAEVRRWWALTEALAGEEWFGLRAALYAEPRGDVAPVEALVRWAKERLLDMTTPGSVGATGRRTPDPLSIREPMLGSLTGS
jgi:hypothetical protein